MQPVGKQMVYTHLRCTDISAFEQWGKKAILLQAWTALGAPEGLGSQNFYAITTWRWKVVSPRRRQPLISGDIPSTNFCSRLNQLQRHSASRMIRLTFSRQMTYIYIYICRTTPLTSRCCILYIYSTNIRTEYFKHAAYSPFFPLQNGVYFIMLPFFGSCIIHFLYTGCAKI